MMEKFISNESKDSLLKIGLYQIICGCIGAIVLIWSLLKTEGISGRGVILLLFVIFLYAFSIFSGYQCLKNKDSSLNLSLINQTIQVLGISVGGFAFRYSAGPFITVGFDMTNAFEWKFDFGLTGLNFYLFSDVRAFIIEVNVIAVIMLIIISRLQTKIKQEIEIRKDDRFL